MDDTNKEKLNCHPNCECTLENICSTKCLKLKEFEKTIQNKDVIIKMLQEQVKKLEESYKANIKETEKFRYKFFLASEQMKRLKESYPGCKEKTDSEKLDEIKIEKPKQKSEDDQKILEKSTATISPSKFNFYQQAKNMENFMKAHYELLRKLIDKILEKKNNAFMNKGAANTSKIEFEEQIMELEKQITSLQDKNKQFTLQPIVEEAQISSKESHLSNKTDRSAQFPSSTKITNNVQPQKPIPEKTASRLQKNFKTSPPQNIISIESYLNFLNSSDYISSKPQKMEIESSSKCKTIPIKKDKSNEMLTKLNQIGSRVEMLLQTQKYTSEKIQNLKCELAICRNNTQVCTENLCKLASAINEQKESFLKKFEQQKEITNCLAKTNDDIQQELTTIREKINDICQTIDNKKSCVTFPECVQECDLKCNNLQTDEEENEDTSITAKCEQEEIGSEDVLDCLAQLSDEKNRKIECIQNLIDCYEKANEYIAAVNNQANSCNYVCPNDSSQSYIDEVKCENYKMNATISSVIYHLNDRLAELKNSEPDQADLLICINNCACDESKTNNSKDLEIKDIYNAIRNCTCNKTERKVTRVRSCADPEDMKCVFCAVSDSNICPEANKEASSVKKCDACSNVSENDLNKSLETYISYLHEQLDTINDIETRIEALRGNVQN